MTTMTAILAVLVGVLVALVVVVLAAYQTERQKRYEEDIHRLVETLFNNPKVEEKPAPPKPDPARECGVVKPKFDEQPRRKGKYKICISFWFNGGRPAWFHDLAEFYRTEGVRKCDFSPSWRMEEEKRLEFIARRIGVHYRNKGAFVRGVSITRRGKQYHFDHFPYPAGVQK